mmetsp:Transcript_30836/g.77098  ORF Transcript_30836/g.77098 Transcript_30836/m.77098 type:complete len:484 (+) Transcript_30836:49-1500(+)
MRYLVVDSGPLIKGARLDAVDAKTYITVPEVMGEIRDRQARAGLQMLPFEIEVKEPSDEAIARVSAFARKTGDYAALSAPDIKVLALTWMLEKECNGAHHLKLEPAKIGAAQPRRAAAPAPQPTQTEAAPPVDTAASSSTDATPASAAVAATVVAAAGGVPERVSSMFNSAQSEEAQAEAEAALLAALEDAELDDNSAAGSDEEDAQDGAHGEGEGGEEGEGEEGDRPPGFWARLPGWATAVPDGPIDMDVTAVGSAMAKLALGAGPEEEDAALPWITVDNMRQVQKRHSRYGYLPDEKTDVCCMTTDFAMQNVIMRMGMKLLSAQGMIMRSVKQWGMQCSGCYRTSHDVSRSFCSHCGNATLVRVALVVDKDGRERVLPIPHQIQAKIFSTRGTVFSIAAPKSGRNRQNIITAEDALAEAKWKHIRNGGKAKQSADVFDSGYDFDAHFGRSGKIATGRAGRVPVAGAGRKNPNDVRTRTKKR